MLRILRRDRGTCLLFGALLVAVYFFKDCKDHKTFYLQTVTKESHQTTIKNNSYVYSWPRCQKNMAPATIRGFRYLQEKFQDFLYYQHCRHFPMLLDMPDKCGGAEESADIFLLLVIKSPPENYERREVLRKTWAKERLYNGVWIRRIFIVGTMGTDETKERLNKVLELEQREYNDILQWDFNESFYNLTLKQILFLEWMERNCPNAQFLLNGDDDVFANTDNMVEYLQSLKDNNGSQHLFTGKLITNASPIRWIHSKYFVPFQVHRSRYYPPYCSGAGYLLSVNTALVIYKMSKSISLVPIDDVYMGMCLAKAGLSPTSHEGVKLFGLSPQKLNDPCFIKDKLVVHRYLSWETYFMWQKIHDPDLNCSTSKEN
ncbi:N-acetyllactosaminide beta-1,3-N-acetylglucosaminyltransferase 3-like [Centropristis striata]|uniref:N-acetyllactosaminide beta-1,3-N-acetylglucosaminyltransferase 3-like n=1 Tax=Centropristis striata TaxID=184440 RepID=UPI0027DEC733|nr:N-acetyllactosaminide beta-1,3-N-acetylglucosaminyltransferase 3-like [Centropristis striata]